MKDQADAALTLRNCNSTKRKADNTATIEAARIAAQTEQVNAKQDLDEAKAILDLAKSQQPPSEITIYGKNRL